MPHSVKNYEKQLTLFLSGGVDVEKTTVTYCLYEALVRYLDRKKTDKNPDELKILKRAPPPPPPKKKKEDRITNTNYMQTR